MKIKISDKVITTSKLNVIFQVCFVHITCSFLGSGHAISMCHNVRIQSAPVCYVIYRLTFFILVVLCGVLEDFQLNTTIDIIIQNQITFLFQTIAVRSVWSY